MTDSSTRRPSRTAILDENGLTGFNPSGVDDEPDESVPRDGRRDGRTVKTAVRGSFARGFARDGRGWPPVVIAVFTLAVWARPVFAHFGTSRLANPGDSVSFEYYLSWNLHALTHLTNPFITPNLYAPAGLNLGNAISLPTVSVLVAPVTAVFGASAAYNVAFLLAIFFAGTSVYLLARELVGGAVGPTIGGLLAVMSPYFVGHGLGHMNLMWVFGLPYLGYVVARYVNGRLRARWVVVLTALTLGFTFGASTELVLTESMFLVVALVVAVVFAVPDVRSRVLRAFGWLVAGGVIGVILGSPVIYAAFSAGVPNEPPNPPAYYSSDLANVFAPTRLFLYGESRFAGLWPHWWGNDAENTAFLPIPILILVFGYLVRSRGRVSAATVTFGFAALVLSFGPYLTINGVFTLPLPWYFGEKLPGLSHALPGRFSAFVFMAVCLLVAMAWSRRAIPRPVVGVAVVAAMALLLPNFTAMAFPSRETDPSFISSGAYQQVVHRGDNVLVLPAGEWGPGMEWIEESGFYFSMPTGNGGGATRPPELSDPLGNALFAQDLTYDFKDNLRPWMARYGVHVVLVPEDDTRYVNVATTALGKPDRVVDHVLVWNVAGG